MSKRYKSSWRQKEHRRRLIGDRLLNPCHICGEQFLADELTIDHLLSRGLGGSNAQSNVALACYPCNGAKARIESAILNGLRKRPDLKFSVEKILRDTRIMLRDQRRAAEKARGREKYPLGEVAASHRGDE